MGDPGGIGPEVVVKALSEAKLREWAHFTVFGAVGPLERAARAASVACPIPGVRVVALPTDEQSFSNTHNATAGKLSFDFVEMAIAAAKLPPSHPDHVEAVVTGPISKEAWAMAGHRYPGHTELFAERFGSERYGMMFYAPPSPSWPSLNAILVTTHLPLAKVPAAITQERVLETIRLGDEAMKRLGHASPRIAVCGLNPHAGESGLLGTEDAEVIGPAIAQAQAQGIDARGPFPGDTIFVKALQGPGHTPEFDLVVAMYHDQGLAPVKLIARDRTVNVTVGLPAVRTSPDHGTAFDIAGKNIADPGSMIAAIELAIRMCKPSNP